MSRPLRINYPNAWYHVMDRSINRRNLFIDDKNYKIFLGLCADISHIYGVQIHAYCLLRTEFHLLIRAPRANLSDAMRHLLSQFSSKYNQLKKIEGPLFKGRYQSILIEGDKHILQVSRYIHRLPKLKKLSKITSLYKWSSYRAYIGQRKPDAWLQQKEILQFLAMHNGTALYRIYVETGKDIDTDNFYHKKRLIPVLGSTAFIKKIAALTDQSNPDVADARLLVTPPSIENIIDDVARYFLTKKEKIITSTRGRNSSNIPRAFAINLCRKVGGHSLKKIAKAFGVSHYSSVTASISRLEHLLEQDHDLALKLNELLKKLVA